MGFKEVKVPKLVVAPPSQAPVGDDGGGNSGDGEEVVAVGDDGGGSSGDGEEMAAIASAQTKHVALQKKAAAASMVVVDITRRFESGDVESSMKDAGGEDQALSNVKVMCRLCFSGENEGGERARKMMACKSCGKKCHLSCLKAWGQHRDLFHWSSWTCPSCRLCEGCQRTGDPNKFMYCKRCDAAYHCYCMQPPQKNISSGPYLCPKHTKCHSCCSNVPGKGPSLRWFLGYTCCDACGKLFLKGNYCHVCLKVYRDSETTPMVCCDICQRWVHCQCDGISDEKYLQFQLNENLPYACPSCRGNSYQVINLEDAVQELWRRRDIADKDLIARLRAEAGLPVEDEIFSISPFSDDEDGSEDPVQLRENENLERNDTAAKLGGRKGAGAGVPDTRNNKLASVKHAEAGPASSDDLNDEENSTHSISNSTRTDPKPLLWFKFKNPYYESQNAWASPGEEEKSMVKGQRSKRKRAPAIGEKSSTRSDDNSSQRYEDNRKDEFLDANWIMQKLGQDAKGKRVEFHHPFDNTWHRGTGGEVFEGSSVVCVALDDEKKNLDLGKQGIHFVSQKQKH